MAFLVPTDAVDRGELQDLVRRSDDREYLVAVTLPRNDG